MFRLYVSLTRQKFGESSNISTLLLPPGKTRSILLRNVDARFGVAPLAVQLCCKSAIRPKIREPNMTPSGSKIFPTWYGTNPSIDVSLSVSDHPKLNQHQVKNASSYLQSIFHSSIGVDSELIVLGDDGQELPKTRAQATPKLRTYYFKFDQLLSILRRECGHFPAE